MSARQASSLKAGNGTHTVATMVSLAVASPARTASHDQLRLLCAFPCACHAFAVEMASSCKYTKGLGKVPSGRGDLTCPEI